VTEDRSPKYGLTSSTQKPVRIACQNLLRATSTIHHHHEIEKPAFDRILAEYSASIDNAPPDARDELRAHGARLTEIAEKLRTARAALRDELVAMGPAIADVMSEEHSLHPQAMFMADDEPHPTREPPWPIGGIEDELGPLEWLRLVTETVRWSREISYSYAALALGPCYLLSYVIEHPKPQASGLRDIAGEARDHLRTFLHSAYGT
jgi:hypothetical protein